MNTRIQSTIFWFVSASFGLGCGVAAGPGAPQGPEEVAAAPAAPARCTTADGGRPYSKYKWPFFGDLHQHTAHSLDAYSFGTRKLPADAYAFAKGDISIVIGTGTDGPPGPEVHIDRPLDFLAVTDHSEWLGVAEGCLDENSTYYRTDACAEVRATNPLNQYKTFLHMQRDYQSFCAPDAPLLYRAQCAAETRTAWGDLQTAARDAYEPCRFTSLVAFEWTNSTGHRNVFFGTDTVPPAPLDSNAYPTDVELWTGLDRQCTSGCSALTVPHNTNQSGGTQFEVPSSTTGVAQMQRYQRLVQIYQHKGSSECFLPASGGDRACGFEYLDQRQDAQKSYVRHALADGLRFALQNPALGNPLELGIIGATDDHNATPGHVLESDFTGHLGRNDDSVSTRLGDTSAQFGAGGITVAWAEQNTREAIFAALSRRETYATSGPRMSVRTYYTPRATGCTADFPRTIIDANTAVPMGGSFHRADLRQNVGAHFSIAAWPDPVAQSLADGTTSTAAIALVEVIKAHGKTTVRQDAPVPVAFPAQGGCVEWTDPNFDPDERAVYYVRIQQVPTWRWSHFDCLTPEGQGVPGCEPGGSLNTAIQERAWTSPIWYAP
ncbi:MAG: DUF3604 domain-containing protein [Myxococcota bacterium]